MKVAELIDLLQHMDPGADVVIFRDAQNYGYGYVKNLRTGLFQETDYGNDFFPDTSLLISANEIKAVCLYPEDWTPPHELNFDRIKEGM